MQAKLGTPNVEEHWLLLVHQLPGGPAYARVKIWRRLKECGAISLRNAAYVLPDSEESRASLNAILREIEKLGGEGMVMRGEAVAGLRGDQLRAQFNGAREADYRAISDELRELSQAWKKRKTPKNDPVQALARIMQRLTALKRIDFFGASGRGTAETLLARLEHSHITRTEPVPEPPRLTDLRNKTWVTRRDIHVDRIASAWLITRFIDPRAKLKFVPGKNYNPLPGEYRYDMQDGEFTHEGDNCSFEVLLQRSGIDDRALKIIAELVHDIDLSDGKFGHPQTAGIAHVIAGICRTQGSDTARLERGRELFDDIYEQFHRHKES
ncbi:MAG TPA: chromate resistance protein ChrB domain-containing protein [Rhizomicrobium sp.]|jgi:hypothetical protein|nr:chromate resistance protein ChrB domain-containing protein [Rhizomicrobium sp.]